MKILSTIITRANNKGVYIITWKSTEEILTSGNPIFSTNAMVHSMVNNPQHQMATEEVPPQQASHTQDTKSWS